MSDAEITSPIGCGSSRSSTSPASSLGKFSCLADEPVEPVGLLVDDRQELVFLTLDQSGDRKQVRHEGFDGGERSAKRMGHSIEQAVRSCSPWRAASVWPSCSTAGRAPWRWQ